jgi:hypothetical protein
MWVAAVLIAGAGSVAFATEFNVYGFALDGVTAVSVEVGGTTRPAAFARNAFIFSDGALGGTAGISGTVSATMSDGTTRTESFHSSSIEVPATEP